jgi:hypothetical protein
MCWSLWLDDQFKDPECPARHTPKYFVPAGSCEEAIALVENLGPPKFMDLDHDLADGRDAMSFLRWLSTAIKAPPEYRVHSANPVGRKNIESFMDSWKRSLELP